MISVETKLPSVTDDVKTTDDSLINALIVGAGEYTTGYTSSSSDTDKPSGVVALTLFDLVRRGLVNRLGICATNTARILKAKAHLKKTVSAFYNNIEVDFTGGTFPSSDESEVVSNPESYLTAFDSPIYRRGDICCIFTPDDTHKTIALAAMSHGLHVLLAKPAVKTVQDHMELIQAAYKNNVLVHVDFHKRWDPIYEDARWQIRNNGDFSFFSSFMSQPKTQLETFKNWAGKASDVSYYLNSHHIDFHCWAMQDLAMPIDVVASASSGLAESFGLPKGTEDTITLVVRWKNIKSETNATAVYTAGWSSPSGVEVHSQQRFFCLSHKGEVRIDQAHRGYESMVDGKYKCCNPLFMKYSPDENGCFDGQQGYGYRSIESFVRLCNNFNRTNKIRPYEEFETANLGPSLLATIQTTAILEAGRRSLDNGGARIQIKSLLQEPRNKVKEILP